MSGSESDSENKEEKIKIMYNGKEKEIDTPDNYKGLLASFLKAFKTDKDKEYIFYYKDNGKDNNIDKNLTLSDFNNIDKVYVKEPKKEKEEENEDEDERIDEAEGNQFSDLVENESQEENEEKVKIIYNGLEKIIDTPENYKGLLEAFLKEFKTDKDKEYIFFYKDNGKENIIKKGLTLSDFNDIHQIWVKEPKKENEDEGEIIEEMEVEKKIKKDPNLTYMSDDNLIQKDSCEIEEKSSSKQDINTEPTLNIIKEVNKTQNSIEKKSEDMKNEETISIDKENNIDKRGDNKEILEKKNSDKKSLEKGSGMSCINPASLSKKSLDKISLDKYSEDQKSVEEEDEYMKINPNSINDIKELGKKMKEIQDIMKKLYRKKIDEMKKLKNELKEKENEIQRKEDQINLCKSFVEKKFKSQISEKENEKNKIKSIINSIEGNKSKEAKEQTKKNGEKQKEIDNLNTKKSEQKDLNVKLKSENEKLSAQKKELENQLKEWKKKLEEKIRREKGGNSREIYDLILPINDNNLEEELNNALKKKEEKEEKKKVIQLKLSNQFQKKFKKYQKEKSSFNKSGIIERENDQKKIIFEKYRSKYGKENLDNNIEGNDSRKIDELREENKDLKNKIKSLKMKKQKKGEVKPEQDSDDKKEEVKNSSEKKLIETINNTDNKEKEEDEEKKKEEDEKKKKEEDEKKIIESSFCLFTNTNSIIINDSTNSIINSNTNNNINNTNINNTNINNTNINNTNINNINNNTNNNNTNINVNDAPLPIVINKNINPIQDRSNESPIEYYSYKCVNAFNLSSYIYEKTESTTIEVEIENNGSQIWPKNDAYLKFDSKSEIKGDDLILKPQKPNEKMNYEIQFNNLSEYKEGEYKSYMHFYINEENYGERLVLTIKISKKIISEVEQNLDKIKEFRELYDLNESDYSNEKLYNALKNNDFDIELAFSSLFE